MNAALALAAVSLAVWLYLLFGRGYFWCIDRPAPPPPPRTWPSVVAVVPARNEAAVVGEAVGSLLRQDYPGRFDVVVMDDHSDDDTAAVARRTAAALGKSHALTVLAVRPLPPGWTGKLWALNEGVSTVEARNEPPEFLLFTDADIAHHPTNLAELVARSEAERRDLVSLMVLLRCRSWAERLLIPAFVFFSPSSIPSPGPTIPPSARRRPRVAACSCAAAPGAASAVSPRRAMRSSTIALWRRL